MDLPSSFLSACPQPAPFVTVGVGLKGCELLHVDDLYPPGSPACPDQDQLPYQ